MKQNKFGAICLALAAAATAHAGTGAYDTIISQVVDNNLALKAEKASLESRGLEIKAENNLADPEVGFEHQWGKGSLGNKWNVTVSQSFDWPGAYRARSRASQEAENAFAMLYRSKENELRLNTRRLLIDITYCLQRRKLTETVSDNVSRLNELISKAYEHGQATILDLSKIKLQLAESRTALETIDSELASLRADLIALNGNQNVAIDGLDSYDSDRLLTEEQYLETIDRSDVMAASLIAESDYQLAGARAARLGAYPGFSLGYVHNVELGEKFNGFSVSVTLPFFSNRHKSQSARLAAEAAELAVTDYRMSAQTRIVTDFAAARRIEKRIDAYDAIFANDVDYLALLKKSYDGGQITVLDYLLEINYFTEARLNYLALCHDYRLRLADLNRYITTD